LVEIAKGGEFYSPFLLYVFIKIEKELAKKKLVEVSKKS
jgi:hypothetical protein